MTSTLVLTVIGDDRAGLVGDLAQTISAHQGNWLKSSMAQLAGKFAGIVEISIADKQVTALQTALGGLAGLKVTAERAGGAKSAAAGRRLKLSLVGHDRIGIVREVSQTLGRFAVNVEKLVTHTASAPMSADVLFHAEAELTADGSLDVGALISELERLSADLMVDIALDESIRQR